MKEKKIHYITNSIADDEHINNPYKHFIFVEFDVINDFGSFKSTWTIKANETINNLLDLLESYDLIICSIVL